MSENLKVYNEHFQNGFHPCECNCEWHASHKCHVQCDKFYSHVIMCVTYDYNIKHECNRRSIFCHFSKI